MALEVKYEEGTHVFVVRFMWIAIEVYQHHQPYYKSFIGGFVLFSLIYLSIIPFVPLLVLINQIRYMKH